MRRPKDTITTPNGNWNYTQNETGKKFHHPNWNVIKSEVWKHRMALPELNLDTTGGWEERWAHELCLQNEHIPWENIEDKGRWVAMGDVWKFLWTILDFVLAGMKPVSQEEAEKRAATCATGAKGMRCPHNEHVDGCWGCKGVGSLVSRIIGNRQTSRDKDLQVCTACGGCVLKVKVWFPSDVIHVDQEKLPSWCWQKRTVETTEQPS